MTNRLSFCLCFALLLTGCGSGPKLAPVIGVLTYKGTPMPNVQLDFSPEQGRPSWGQTDAEGRFTLEYDPDHKGVILGKHKVFAKMGRGWEKIPGVRPDLTNEQAEFFEKYSAANSKVMVEIEANTRELMLAWD